MDVDGIRHILQALTTKPIQAIALAKTSRRFRPEKDLTCVRNASQSRRQVFITGPLAVKIQLVGVRYDLALPQVLIW